MKQLPHVEGFIPCFNNEASLAQTIEGLRAQTFKLERITVIDDGSTDRSAQVARDAGAVVLGWKVNRGRGAARAQAMTEAHAEYVVHCDGTCALSPDFVEKALIHAQDPSVAAVVGRFIQPEAQRAADRWRGRHLFNMGAKFCVEHKASLATAGVLFRRNAVLEVGNFRSDLAAGEDLELGRRLLGAKWDVMFDPELHICPFWSNTVPQVLERYARWRTTTEGGIRLSTYLREVYFSLKVMARNDLTAGDLPSAFISVAAPHYRALKAISQKK